MTNEVRKQSKAVEQMAENWPMLNALLGGTAEMRKRPEFLPKWPNEDIEAYNCRLRMATLFPAYARTVEVLSAKPFARPLQLNKASSRIQSWAEDIDLQGRSLHVYAGDLLEEALGKGLAGVLVEYPQAEGVRTQADEQQAGVRPYFVHIKADQLLGWRKERVNGKDVLTQLRFLENVAEPDGPFGEKLIEQVRVLYPGRWEVYRKNDKDVWALFEEGQTTLPAIPFVPAYGQRTGFMTALPPLLDVAFLNVEHWQSKSDQQNILHVARVPILTMIGGNEETQLTVGGAAAVKLGAGGDLKFTEHSGSAIGSGRQSLLDLQDQMRQAGAELLVIQPVKTVAQVLSDNEAGRCALARITIDVEDALNQALALMAEWVKDDRPGTVELYKDFGFDTLAQADADLLLKMNMAGKLSDETLFMESKRRGLIDHDLDWEAERERIQAQGPALGAMNEPAPANG